MEKWFNVNEDARVWAGHADAAQKQGWLRAPAAILAIDEYKGSYQFEEVKVDEELGGADEREVATSSYPQYWIRIENTSLEPYNPDAEPPLDDGSDPPPPPPDTRVISDAELGAAIRTVITVIAEKFGFGGTVNNLGG